MELGGVSFQGESMQVEEGKSLVEFSGVVVFGIEIIQKCLFSAFYNLRLSMNLTTEERAFLQEQIKAKFHQLSKLPLTTNGTKENYKYLLAHIAMITGTELFEKGRGGDFNNTVTGSNFSISADQLAKFYRQKSNFSEDFYNGCYLYISNNELDRASYLARNESLFIALDPIERAMLAEKIKKTYAGAFPGANLANENACHNIWAHLKNEVRRDKDVFLQDNPMYLKNLLGQEYGEEIPAYIVTFLNACYRYISDNKHDRHGYTHDATEDYVDASDFNNRIEKIQEPLLAEINAFEKLYKELGNKEGDKRYSSSMDLNIQIHKLYRNLKPLVKEQFDEKISGCMIKTQEHTYRVEDLVAFGKFSMICKATILTGDREEVVAVKFLHSIHYDDKAIKNQFKEGAKQQYYLGQDNSGIVPVLNLPIEDKDAKLLFYAMAYINGASLHALVLGEGSKLLDKEAYYKEIRKIFLAVSKNIIALHRQDVANINATPRNILLPQHGEPPLLTDFDNLVVRGTHIGGNDFNATMQSYSPDTLGSDNIYGLKDANLLDAAKRADITVLTQSLFFSLVREPLQGDKWRKQIQSEGWSNVINAQKAFPPQVKRFLKRGLGVDTAKKKPHVSMQAFHDELKKIRTLEPSAMVSVINSTARKIFFAIVFFVLFVSAFLKILIDYNNGITEARDKDEDWFFALEEADLPTEVKRYFRGDEFQEKLEKILLTLKPSDHFSDIENMYYDVQYDAGDFNGPGQLVYKNIAYQPDEAIVSVLQEVRKDSTYLAYPVERAFGELFSTLADNCNDTSGGLPAYLSSCLNITESLVGALEPVLAFATYEEMARSGKDSIGLMFRFPAYNLLEIKPNSIKYNWKNRGWYQEASGTYSSLVFNFKLEEGCSCGLSTAYRDIKNNMVRALWCTRVGATTNGNQYKYTLAINYSYKAKIDHFLQN